MYNFEAKKIEEKKGTEFTAWKVVGDKRIVSAIHHYELETKEVPEDIKKELINLINKQYEQTGGRKI